MLKVKCISEHFFILFYIEQNKESFGSYVSEGKVKLSGRL